MRTDTSVLLPIRLADRPVALLERVLDAWERVEAPAGGFELVLCCDGPDPRVPALARGRRVPLRVLSQDAAGQSAATNRAARAARGTLLVFAAQDVVPDGGILQAHRSAHADHPGSAILGALPYPAPSEGFAVTPFMHFLVHGGPQFAYDRFTHDREIRPYRLYAPNFSLDRSLFEAVGGFCEALPYGCQDSDLGLRLHARGVRCVYRADAVGFHWHPQELTGYAERQYRCGRSVVEFTRRNPLHASLAALREAAITDYRDQRGQIDDWVSEATQLEAASADERARSFVEIPDGPYGGACFVPTLNWLYDRITRFHFARGIDAQLCAESGGDAWRRERAPGAEIPEGRAPIRRRLPTAWGLHAQ